MRGFSLTKKARADLKSIVIYTQRKWGREQRKLYARQFDDAFQMLCENPLVGSGCDFIKVGYRKFPVSSHVIFYRSKNRSEIEVVRILHKHMDVSKQFEIS